MGRREGSPLIVLDTHAWLWWCNSPQRLSRTARTAVERHGAIGISAISCWELAMLERLDRVRFDQGAATWLRRALSQENTELLQVTADIAIRAGQLHGVVPEPADALVYATALEYDRPLVTRDGLLHDVDPARVIW